MTFESQITNQAGKEQLDRIAAEFDRWRRQKTNRSEKIPESLLREAQKLTQHYKTTEVRRRLGLTKSQLDKFERQDQVSRKEPEEASGLMRLVPHRKEAHHKEAHSPGLTIDICTPQGIKISLSGFSTQDPLAIIAKLVGA